VGYIYDLFVARPAEDAARMRAMSAREIIGVVVVIVGSLCGLVGALANVVMIEKVNARLPKEQPFS
jgi:hypothetical protein